MDRFLHTEAQPGRLNELTGELKASGLSTEALLISYLLLPEQDREQNFYQFLASSGLKESGSPLYPTFLILLNRVESIFEDMSYVEQVLMPNWKIHCLFIL